MNHRTWNKSLLFCAATTLIVAASTTIWFSTKTALGLATGAFLMLGNLYFLRRAALWMMAGKAAATTVLILIKFGALLVAAWLALRYLPIHPFAFGLGIVGVPLALALSCAVLAKETT